MKLVKNIKVKVGEFTTREGQTKGKYITVGKVLVDNDGKEMVLLDKTFNPAGVPGDKESIILNFWEVEEKRDVPAEAQAGINQLQSSVDADTEIPF